MANLRLPMEKEPATRYIRLLSRGRLPLSEGAHMNRYSVSVAVAGWMLAAAAYAQVGTLQGTVSGVQAGTVLEVMKGDAKVADLKVEAGGKYSLALQTGVYTVKCPNGAT